MVEKVHHGSAQFGTMLREWRGLRQVSQLALAVDADISQRHLSFLESGRARPSREMVLRIATALDLPLRARNELLESAGFAAFYPERALSASELRSASEALERIIAHHEPYPAFILNRHWNIVMTNGAAQRLIARCVSADVVAELSAKTPLNFMRLTFHPKGIRARVRNWEQIAGVLIARLRREAHGDPGSPSESLLRELATPAEKKRSPQMQDLPLSPAIALELQTDDGSLRLFNTLTTFGTPQDVTLQELRIEMSFPIDEASKALLQAWGEAAGTRT